MEQSCLHIIQNEIKKHDRFKTFVTIGAVVAGWYIHKLHKRIDTLTGEIKELKKLKGE